MPRRRKQQDPAARLPTPARQPVDAVVIASLHEINEYCLELLIESSRARKPASLLPLIGSLRDLLKALQPAVRRRAASCCFPLVDMEFADRQWWQAAKSQPVRPWKESAPLSIFPKQAAIRLARVTLTVAWNCVRSDVTAACVLFGMSTAVAEIIGALRPFEIEVIAERQFHRMRPRWETRPQIWRDLLMAAMGADAAAMRDVAIYAHQLLSAETGPHSK